MQFFFNTEISGKRDETIDIVRGLAVCVMLAANMAPSFARQTPYLLRVIFSSAAPIFVTFAGAMITRSVITNNMHGIIYFLQRGMFFLFCGALLDITANAIPFITVDVLSFIGVSMPVLYLIAHCRTRVIIMMTGAIFILTFVFQQVMGYSPQIIYAHIGENVFVSPVEIMKHWMVDGWFPLFPWLGYGACGVLLARLRWQSAAGFKTFNRKAVLLPAISLFIAGLAMMSMFPGPQNIRSGYQEIFYPNRPGFLTWSLSLIFCLVGLVDATRSFKMWKLFRPLGEAPFFVYIGHLLMIGVVIEDYFPSMDACTYFMNFTGLFIVFFISTAWLRKVRKSYKNMPTVLRWVIGG